MTETDPASTPPSSDTPVSRESAVVSTVRSVMGPVPHREVRGLCGWFILLVLGSFAMTFYHLEGGAGFEPTDCWVAQTAREMADADEWLVPVFSGETRMQKSPGPYWSVMLVSELLGRKVDELTARVPNAVAGVLLVITVFFLTRRIGGDRAAVFGGFAAASSVLVLYWSHRAASDLGLAALCAISVACLWSGMNPRRPGLLRHLLIVLGWFAAGLGMLYKMPMPLVCVGLPIFGWLCYRYPRTMTPVALCAVAAIMLLKFEAPIAFVAIPVTLSLVWLIGRGLGNPMAATSAPWSHKPGFLLFILPWLAWVLAVMQVEPAALLKWRVEFLDRFTGDLPNVRGQDAWWYHFIYLGPMFLFTIPYCLSLPAAFRRAFKREAGVDRGGMIFMVIWFVSLFAFFTLSTGKETRYLLPAIPPLFVLLGCELSAFFDPKRSTSPKLDRLSTAAIIVGIPAGIIAGFFALKEWQEHDGIHTWREVWPPYAVAVGIFAAGALLAAWLHRTRRRNASFAALVITMLATWLWVWPQLMPVIANEIPFVNFATQLRERIPPEDRSRIRQIGTQDPRIVWYSDVRFPRIIDQLDLLEMQGGDRSLKREMRIVAEEMIRQLDRPERVLMLAARRDYDNFLSQMHELHVEAVHAPPKTYEWLRTEIGPPKAHFVLFSNHPPPW